MIHQEMRWAVWHPSSKFFAGRFCWPDATTDEPCIPTFSSKRKCREAIERMCSYRHEVEPRRVSVTVLHLHHPLH